MRIATFNINGVKARSIALPAWLDEANPDVVLLQEIKSIDENFPRELFEDRGYNVETHGQKSFNGVAILLPMTFLVPPTSVGARAVRLCGLYLPNGNPVPGPKFDYKLAWMERLEARARDLLAGEEPALMAGDYNIIPQPEDAKRPQAWEGDALYRPESLRAWRRIVNLGFTEAFRAREAARGHYSFWDFQAGAWDRNDGIRIDHFLLTPQCADLLVGCEIHARVRGGEKPSDHVPVVVELDA